MDERSGDSMIVGISKIDAQEMAKHTKTVEEFKEYCISLVPEEFRHVKAIVGNQTYLCCLELRRNANVNWDTKKLILNTLLREVHIVGCTNELINVADMLVYIER